MHCTVCKQRMFSSFQMEATCGWFHLRQWEFSHWLNRGIGFTALVFEIKSERTLCLWSQWLKHCSDRCQALLKWDINICLREADFLTCGSSELSVLMLSDGNITAFNRFLGLLINLLLQALLLLLCSSACRPSLTSILVITPVTIKS